MSKNKQGKFKRIKLQERKAQAEALTHKRGRKEKSVIQGSGNIAAGRQGLNKEMTNFMFKMSTYHGQLMGKEWPEWYKFIYQEIFSAVSSGRMITHTSSLLVIRLTLTVEDFRKSIIPIAHRFNTHFRRQAMVAARYNDPSIKRGENTMWEYVVVICQPFGEFQLPPALNETQVKYLLNIRDASLLRTFEDDQNLGKIKGSLLLPLDNKE